MKNLMMIAAIGVMATASAQTGQPVQQPEGTVQAPAPTKSVYDECLHTAGQHTWTALGLNSDQMERVSRLQGRYKEMMAPPKEPEKATKKSKKVKDQAKAAEKQPMPDAADNAGHDKRMMEKDADLAAQPATTGQTAVKDTNATANTAGGSTLGDGAQSGAQPSVDDELRMILTPEQLALWDKRCEAQQSTGMVQP